MGILTNYLFMSYYTFDIYQEGEFIDRVSTLASDYNEAESLTVEEYGDEIELVRIENF